MGWEPFLQPGMGRRLSHLLPKPWETLPTEPPLFPLSESKDCFIPVLRPSRPQSQRERGFRSWAGPPDSQTSQKPPELCALCAWPGSGPAPASPAVLERSRSSTCRGTSWKQTLLSRISPPTAPAQTIHALLGLVAFSFVSLLGNPADSRQEDKWCL